MSSFWTGFEKQAGLVQKAVGNTLNYKELMKEFVAKNKGSARGMPMRAAAPAAAPLGQAAAKVTAAAPAPAAAAGRATLSPHGVAATANTTRPQYSRIGPKTWIG